LRKKLNIKDSQGKEGNKIGEEKG